MNVFFARMQHSVVPEPQRTAFRVKRGRNRKQFLKIRGRTPFEYENLPLENFHAIIVRFPSDRFVIDNLYIRVKVAVAHVRRISRRHTALGGATFRKTVFENVTCQNRAQQQQSEYFYHFFCRYRPNYEKLRSECETVYKRNIFRTKKGVRNMRRAYNNVIILLSK